MKLSIATILLAVAGVVSAMPQDPELVARQNQNRPVPNGTCCVANTNLKQDACRAANGQAGRCVPGGNNCKCYPRLGSQEALLDMSLFADTIGSAGGSRLSCVAQSSLTCNNNVIERGKSLCRANAPGGGFFDGARIIRNLNQATVN